MFYHFQLGNTIYALLSAQHQSTGIPAHSSMLAAHSYFVLPALNLVLNAFFRNTFASNINSVDNKNQDWFYSSIQFQNFFKSSSRSLVVKANPPLFTILAVSDSYLRLTHRQRSDLINKNLFTIFPGSAEDPSQQDNLLHSLTRVIASKKSDTLPDYQYEIWLPDTREWITQHWSNTNEPVFDEEGNVAYIVRTVTNITEKLQTQKALAETNELKASLEREQALNEELASTNEEITAINEELHKAQQDLHALNNELEARIAARTKALAESERKLRYMLAEAPLAIALVTGKDLVIYAANKKMLEAWGKAENIVGKPLRSALPELDGQPFLNWLDEVFATGEPHYGNEVKAVMEQNGLMQEVYSNFVYYPLKDDNGQTTDIVLVANLVTDLVVARKKAEEAEAMLRLATESAEIGTWQLNLTTYELIVSPRYRQIFGFAPGEEITYKQALARIVDDYEEQVRNAVRASVEKGENFSIEYQVPAYPDQKPRWIRAVGKVNHNDDGKPAYMTGIVVDITEQKQDEQRKNDFIGMVSHELKTPLTSMGGYLQMLQARAKTNEDEFATGILERARKQVRKMTTLINGFLNVSRLESGKIHIDKTLFDIAELVKEAEEDALAMYNSHRIVFAPVAPTYVHADRDKIGQVVSNLISNAVKYSPVHTTIHVACITVDNMAQVSVQDEGIGIKPEDKDKLFERYYRANTNISSASGFGIGLYLCAEIIQRHNGNIWVNSELAKGSTFYFTVPLSAEA